MPRSAFLSRSSGPPTPLDSVRIVKGIAVLMAAVFVVSQVGKAWQEKRAIAREAEQRREQQQVKDAAHAKAVAKVRASRDADDLREAFNGFDKATRSHVIGFGGLRAAFAEWYARDLAFALSMVEGVPEKNRLDVFRWGEPFYQKDPARFLAAARRLLDHSGENSVSFRIFRDLGKTDPAKGVALLPDVRRDIVRRTAIEVFYHHWAASDPRAATESAVLLEDTRDRSYALAAVSR